MDASQGLYAGRNGNGAAQIERDRKNIEGFLAGSVELKVLLSELGLGRRLRNHIVNDALKSTSRDPQDLIEFCKHMPPETFRRILAASNTEMIDLCLKYDLIPLEMSGPQLRGQFYQASLVDTTENEVAHHFMMFNEKSIENARLKADMAVQRLIELNSFTEDNEYAMSTFIDALEQYKDHPQYPLLIASLCDKISLRVESPIDAVKVIQNLTRDEAEPLSLNCIANIARSMRDPQGLLPNEQGIIDDILFHHITCRIENLALHNSRRNTNYEYQWKKVREELSAFEDVITNMHHHLPKTAVGISALHFFQQAYTPKTQQELFETNGNHVHAFIAALEGSEAIRNDKFARGIEQLIEKLRVSYVFNAYIVLTSLRETNVFGGDYFDLIAQDKDLCHAIGRLLIDVAEKTGRQLPRSIQTTLATDDRWGFTLLRSGYQPEGFVEHLSQVCGPVTYFELVRTQLNARLDQGTSTEMLPKDAVFEMACRYEDMCSEIERDSSGAYRTARQVMNPSVSPDEIAATYLSGAYRENLRPLCEQLLGIVGIDPAILNRSRTSTATSPGMHLQ